MTLLGFKERFVAAIEARTKKHTIRAIPADGRVRFAVGRPVQLYRRMRQADMRKIVDVDPLVTKIETITIERVDGEARLSDDRPFHPGAYVNIGGRDVGLIQVEELRAADGFPDFMSFLTFFTPKNGDVFTGHIIHWDWR